MTLLALTAPVAGLALMLAMERLETAMFTRTKD